MKASLFTEKSSPESQAKTTCVVYFILITLPFLLFYWMLPFIGGQSIGQDYQTIGIQSQMELFFSIKTGAFPLYAPGFAFGNSSSTLTLGQLYHPFAYLASLLPGYWNGKALEWNSLLRLLSLGSSHIVLFVFLRKLRLNLLFSFLLSFITVYNLRMLDLFRYGASLEAYTGYVLLCAVIGCYFINPTRLRGPLSIIGLTYWLVCSGHPQMMYYGVLGAGLFMLVAPFFISTLLPEVHIDFKSVRGFWVRTCFYGMLGILLSSAYILPYYFDNVKTIAGRVGQGYAWADSYGDTFIGTLNSFFLPLRSDIHGNFGGSSFFIVALIVPALKLFKIKIPKSIWIIWLLLLLFFLYMQGGRSPVHWLVWQYLPFASSFRVAGRISLIIPVFLMMLLIWLVRADSISGSLRGRSTNIKPLTILTSVSVLVMGVYYLLFILPFSPAMLEYGHFTPVVIRKIPRLIEIAVMMSGAASLIALTLYSAFPRRSVIFGTLLCIMSVLQVGITLKYGVWSVEKYDKPTFHEISSEKREKLDYRHHAGYGVYSSVVDTQINRSFMEPYLGKIYFDVVPVSSQEEAYSMMEQNYLPQRIYVEDYKPSVDVHVEGNEVAFGKGKVELIYSSFNMLRFNVSSSAPAIFGLSYPYSGHWEARVNGNNVRAYRANGSAHAVPIRKGESIIEFRYWSAAAFWGMILSCSTFILIGLYMSFRRAFGLIRVLAAMLVLFIGAGGFSLWYHSLYAGDNLKTEYTWSYKPPLLAPNIAYGKKTFVSEPLSGGFFLPNHSSRAVDGNISPDSGFSTSAHANPFIIVDLNKPQTIRSITLYESARSRDSNTRPLTVAFSMDQREWRTAATVTSRVDSDNPVQIIFETNQEARYVKIQASDYCNLKLDEIEIY